MMNMVEIEVSVEGMLILGVSFSDIKTVEEYIRKLDFGDLKVDDIIASECVEGNKFYISLSHYGEIECNENYYDFIKDVKEDKELEYKEILKRRGITPLSMSIMVF